ncbi:MAG: ABC transporter ATP-binding protein [Candidatus Pelagadaptatus aseana]|uniref:ABC transporter ATP-binding protein n=1 Tax=Candidatus Pelagadaptatus aseana TaxID=3120508 RepID=UPI0039B30A4D
MTIELSGVRFCYPESPGEQTLNIHSWRVAGGEQVFLHGPSGGGKTTLLNILSGMLPATEGRVEVLGERLDGMSRRRRDSFRARHIGYIFQQFNLIPYLDALDNIRLANHFSQGQSVAELQANASGLLNSFGLDPSDMTKPVGKLSVGQQQRIAIARAMINKPEILIADEPTSSLDQVNRDHFMAELMAMVSRSNTTLIFVSHDMSLASYFDRVDALTDINRTEVMS